MHKSSYYVVKARRRPIGRPRTVPYRALVRAEDAPDGVRTRDPDRVMGRCQGSPVHASVLHRPTTSTATAARTSGAGGGRLGIGGQSAACQGWVPNRLGLRGAPAQDDSCLLEGPSMAGRSAAVGGSASCVRARSPHLRSISRPSFSLSQRPSGPHSGAREPSSSSATTSDLCAVRGQSRRPHRRRDRLRDARATSSGSPPGHQGIQEGLKGCSQVSIIDSRLA
jgi:hypothetical protein